MRFFALLTCILTMASTQAMDFYFAFKHTSQDTTAKPQVTRTHYFEDGDVTSAHVELQAGDYTETIEAGYYPDADEPYSCEWTNCLDKRKIEQGGYKARLILEAIQALRYKEPDEYSKRGPVWHKQKAAKTAEEQK